LSGTAQAVFISYASQDAEAASRICESLRAAGIEVWFDQTELRGGDAWDRKIRQQIRDCALFVPIISAHTQARPEGYFRLEWKLAVDRSHLMAAEKAFFVPVVVDATTEPEALVPAQFLEVQWTRIQSGEVPAAFVDRIAALLNQPVAPHVADPKRAPSRPPLRRLPIVLTVLSVVAVVALVIATAIRGGSLWHKPVPKVEASTTATRPAAIPEKSVAVLPFVDMSEKKDQEYFSDGLSEEVLDLLSRVPELHVVARTSAFSFKGKSDDIPTIARKLHVANILEGSVRRSGNHLRVTAQLVRADNGYHLWSQTYDRKLDDIFTIQDDIAGSVVQALKVALLEGSPPKATETQSTEAYTLYVQAKSMLSRSATPEEYERVIDYLQQVVKLDPRFAPAWASLSRVHSRRATGGSTPGLVAQDIEAARRAARQALALDPSLAAGHQAMSIVLGSFDWDWTGAQAEAQKALALDPGSSSAVASAGVLAFVLGQYDKALTLLQRATATDPLNADAQLYLGYVFWRVGKYSEALIASRKALDLNPELPDGHFIVASTLLKTGDAAGALRETELSSDFERSLSRAYVFHALGRKADADLEVTAFERKYAEEDPFHIAGIHAFRGESDLAFAWLDRAYRQRDTGLEYIKCDPLFENLQADPRYKAFLRKMNLPE